MELGGLEQSQEEVVGNRVWGLSSLQPPGRERRRGEDGDAARQRPAGSPARAPWQGGDEDPGKGINSRGVVLVAGEGEADVGSPACGVEREEEGDLEEEVGGAGRSKKEEGDRASLPGTMRALCGGVQEREGEMGIEWRGSG